MTESTERVEESKPLYRALVESAPDAVFVADADTGRIVETNVAGTELVSRSREALIGLHQTALHPSEDRERYRALFQQHARPGDVPDRSKDRDPLYVTTADGDRVRVEINVSTVEIDGRRLVIGHFRDVSERYARERELRAVCRSIPGLAIIYDAEGVYREVLSEQRELLVDPPSVLEGTHVTEALPDDVAEQILDAIEDALDTDEIQRLTYSLELDGETDRRWFAARLTPLQTTGSDSEDVLFLAREITESEYRKRNLRSFKTAVEQAGHAVLLTDADGAIEYVNPAFEAVTGYEESEVLGEQPSVLQSGEHDESFYRDLWETISDGEVWEGDLLNERKDGQQYHIHQTIAPITDEDGTIERFVGINTDISDRKQYERQLEREHEQLDLFASTVAHTLRNPLAIALGNAELALDSDTGEPLEATLDALERMEAMIDEILTLSKQGRTVQDPEPIPFERALRRAWAEVDTGEATLSIPDTAVSFRITADRARFRKLLVHLLRNAVEHGSADAGSDVQGEDSPTDRQDRASADRADATNRSDASVRITAGRLCGGEGFFVEDDGCGIDAEPTNRIFNTGFSTAEDGVGFGLTIVEQIAAAHGWDVSVGESAADGARFEFQTAPVRITESEESAPTDTTRVRGLNAHWNQSPRFIEGGSDETECDPDRVRVWLVERTYPEDERNRVRLTYATPDGERRFRKSRELRSPTSAHETTAAVHVDPDALVPVKDPTRRTQYAAEARRMRTSHAPDELI